MNIAEAILNVYPDAIDCINGHIGVTYESLEQEEADDRYYTIKVKRCSHCKMPVGGEEYV